jgi:hypothetical protein
MVRAVIVLVLLVFLPAVAHADKRLALLIGNEACAPTISRANEQYLEILDLSIMGSGGLGEGRAGRSEHRNRSAGLRWAPGVVTNLK